MKNMINENLMDVLITSKMNVSDSLYDLDDSSLSYLKQLLNIYQSDEYDNSIDKYKAMLLSAGEDKVTKICRDIRLCINNLSRVPYVAEYDHSEEELSNDMVYVQMLINHNSQKKEGEV